MKILRFDEGTGWRCFVSKRKTPPRKHHKPPPVRPTWTICLQANNKEEHLKIEMTLQKFSSADLELFDAILENSKWNAVHAFLV
jgi:hypothetical protein